MLKKAMISTALFTLIIVNLLIWPYVIGKFDKDEKVQETGTSENVKNTDYAVEDAKGNEIDMSNMGDVEDEEKTGQQQEGSNKQLPKTETNNRETGKQEKQFRVVNIE